MPIEFTQILLNNADFLKPFATTLTKDSEAAKDLFQETLYRALANKEKYNTGTNIRAWLYTIMKNIFINSYRRQLKRNVIFDNTPNEYLLNYNQTSQDDAMRQVRLHEIQAIIHRLPSVFKIPLMLYFNGYKYQEIALMLNEPIGTIKSRIHFARRLLKIQIIRF